VQAKEYEKRTILFPLSGAVLAEAKEGKKGDF
jgi:hypothetical protein